MSRDGGRFEAAIATESAQMVRDVVRADVVDGVDPVRSKSADEIVEIPAVRLERRGRQSRFDPDVGQEVTNRSVEAGASRRHG